MKQRFSVSTEHWKLWKVQYFSTLPEVFYCSLKTGYRKPVIN